MDTILALFFALTTLGAVGYIWKLWQDNAKLRSAAQPSSSHHASSERRLSRPASAPPAPSTTAAADDDWDLGELEVRPSDSSGVEKSPAPAASSDNSEALFATLSHELRTPLNGILGMVQIMLSEQDEGGRKPDVRLVAVNAGARHMLTLLENLVNLQKLQSADLPEHREWVSPKEVLDNLKQSLRFRAMTRGLNIELDAAESRGRVRTDREHLTTILENLALASLELTEAQDGKQGERESLKISWQLRDGRLAVKLHNPRESWSENREIELAEALLERTGESHQRIRIERLLWAVAQALADRKEGAVSFERSSEGGVITRVVMTLEEMRTTGMTKSPMGSPSLQTNSLKAISEELHVLVAEDDPLNRRVIGYMLKRLGQRFTLVGNGQEALEQVKRDHSIDLILMDIDMPVMDGMSATMSIRQGEAGDHAKGVPVVAVTAFSSTSDQGKFRKNGMDYFIAKPISADKLRVVLLDIIKAKRSLSPSGAGA